jgi:hypothetical protein
METNFQTERTFSSVDSNLLFLIWKCRHDLVGFVCQIFAGLPLLLVLANQYELPEEGLSN